jgi:hypothetical protein
VKFKVTVQRTAVQEIDIEVEAANFIEAERLAVEVAPNKDFSNKEHDAEYVATYCRCVEDHVV